MHGIDELEGAPPRCWTACSSRRAGSRSKNARSSAPAAPAPPASRAAATAATAHAATRHPNGWLTASTQRPAYLWSRARIQRELLPFLRGRRHWPARDEFHAAGLTRLHLNVVLGDGERWWAYRSKLPLADTDARAPWTQQRIQDTLALYLADKTTWPSHAQFTRDRMRSLRQAIINTGGIQHWAPLFPDVAPITRRRGPRNWTDQRIRTELQDVLRDCNVFPTRQHFISRNQERLYAAAIRHGGVQHWAHEFNLPTARTPRRNRHVAE